MAIDPEPLEKFASKYVWWKTTHEAIQYPDRVVARVMNLGDYEDVQALVHGVDSAYLRQVLTGAEAGQFDARSRAYGHYRLGLSEPGMLPALPARKVGQCLNSHPASTPSPKSNDSLAEASECLKALVYFEGGRSRIPFAARQERLITSAAAVDDIPEVPLADGRLALFR